MPGASGPVGHRFDPTILREYDIRGVVGETLSAADARALGRGFGTLLRRAGGTKAGDAPRKLLDVLRSYAPQAGTRRRRCTRSLPKPTTGICLGPRIPAHERDRGTLRLELSRGFTSHPEIGIGWRR